ncbi:phospholipase B1, membrane-associated-like [Sycon ciliatum]|uniref:phospholipase B1, membrane-associated-like n=1 Tax=Sycon ciliatum TaxID=27933 RepID=UPI0020ADE5D2|eukprot:scpid73905/ scgid13991/ Phospholipase B1, membrane-associated; Phospholipase B/lipase; Phospholipase A2; Lysophospholipase
MLEGFPYAFATCCLVLLLAVEIRSQNDPADVVTTRQQDVDGYSSQYGNTGNRGMMIPPPFNCKRLPERNETTSSVHALRPQDVRVVMAMGDSITAGFGMMGKQGTVFKDLIEYRGQSWSIGGDAQAYTLATIIRHFSPDLVGASLGSHQVEVCWGYLCPSFHEPVQDRLNSAQTGAMMYDMIHTLNSQVDYIIGELKKMQQVDMRKDWKVLTIFVGANEMCLRCGATHAQPTSPDDYELYFRKALTQLRDEVPRLFVNVVQMFNVSQVYTVSLRSKHCENIHSDFFVECSCAFWNGSAADERRKDMDEAAVAYNERLEKVVRDFAKNRSDEFVAVLQPAFRDGTAETLPLDFISSLDCFHPSLLAHQTMAKLMWNNMLTPSTKKRTTFDLHDPIICPTEDTVFATD